MTSDGPAQGRAPLISTQPGSCRVCYTCVRECPAKAIRICAGQAEVLHERCIGCGNCVRVCSQSAKRARSSIADVERLLDSEAPVAVIIAPSLPAELTGRDPRRLIGALKAMGFAFVNEVAFGADLVAERYRNLIARADGRRYIASTCPALVAFVLRYHPEVADCLVPIVSPMIASARVLRELHGPELRVVFIGPCIGKKQEMLEPELDGDVDAVLTFREMWTLLAQRKVELERVEPADFDPPHAGLGQVFPLTGGILQASNLKEDLLTANVVTAYGRSNLIAATREFASGALDAGLLEALCCDGCIMGPGMTTPEPASRRRMRVSEYARGKLARLHLTHWQSAVDRFSLLDLSRGFEAHDQRMHAASPEQLTAILSRMGKTSAEDELNCGACGYDSCRDHAVAIHHGLAEPKMCLPYTIDRLRDTVQKLGESHGQLVTTQRALMQAERLASMGQLAAGIAHEINNPLGIVVLYAHQLLDEYAQQASLREDLTMVVEQADRCKKIVSGLLNFARRSKVLRQAVQVPALVDRCLSFLVLSGKVKVTTEHVHAGLTAELDPDQITQVLTNLVSNAVAAMPQGGTLRVTTRSEADQAVIELADTGHGIAASHVDKVFEPFFTTKQMGEGTGLGLAVTYGIIKMHRGSITFSSNADASAGPTGTTFRVSLPIRAQEEHEITRLENEDDEISRQVGLTG